MVIPFSFLGAGFANISPTFLVSCEVQTRYSKTPKHSVQYIREHLSGTKVKIWICSEYDVIFNFSCIALCNLTKSLRDEELFPLSSRCYDHCKTVFYPFSYQQLSEKHSLSSISCNLLVKTKTEKMESTR